MLFVISFYDSTIHIFNVQLFKAGIDETGHHQSWDYRIDRCGRDPRIAIGLPARWLIWFNYIQWRWTTYNFDSIFNLQQKLLLQQQQKQQQQHLLKTKSWDHHVVQSSWLSTVNYLKELSATSIRVTTKHNICWLIHSFKDNKNVHFSSKNFTMPGTLPPVPN